MKQNGVNQNQEVSNKPPIEIAENPFGNPNQQEFECKEGGWGWIVVVACATCFGINCGLINSYAIIYKELISVYNSTENNVIYAAWIGSACNGVQFSLASISGILIDMYSPRKIGFIGAFLSCLGVCLCSFVKTIKLYFLTYSVLVGFGQALLSTSALGILPQYFNKRLGLVNGLTVFGGSILTVTLPFIDEALLKKFGLSNTFLILTGIVSTGCLSALTFKQQIVKHQHINLKQRLIDSSGFQLFKSNSYLLWLTGAFIGYFGYFIPTVTLSHYSSLMFPQHSASIVSSIIGGASGIFGVIFGKLSDHIKINPIYFYIMGFTLSGIAQICIPFATTFVQLCLLSICFGITDGCVLTFVIPVCMSIFQSPKMANQAFGYYFLSISLSSIVGPTIFAGWLFEIYANYRLSYYISGSICLLAATFLLITFPDSILQQLYLKLKKRNTKITPMKR